MVFLRMMIFLSSYKFQPAAAQLSGGIEINFVRRHAYRYSRHRDDPAEEFVFTTLDAWTLEVNEAVLICVGHKRRLDDRLSPVLAALWRPQSSAKRTDAVPPTPC